MLQLEIKRDKNKVSAIIGLNFMTFYIVSFVTKSSNLLTVSSIDTSDFPPAALQCPPP
jgi:hypothetical protein